MYQVRPQIRVYMQIFNLLYFPLNSLLTGLHCKSFSMYVSLLTLEYEALSNVSNQEMLSTLLRQCIAAPVHCCTSALLHQCIAAPVHCCTCALLHLCIATPEHCCTSALLPAAPQFPQKVTTCIPLEQFSFFSAIRDQHLPPHPTQANGLRQS